MLKKFLRFLFIDDVLKEDVAFLKEIPLFKGLPNRLLAKVALVVLKRKYLAGEKIYENNNDANVVYLVKSGQVDVSCGDVNRIVEKKGFFGEISLIENSKYTDSATILKDGELYLIYHAKFEDIIEFDNKMGLIIMTNLASILATKAKCLRV
jgi:CRP-like cAMP-binding protein